MEQADGQRMEVVSPRWVEHVFHWTEKRDYFFTTTPLWVTEERRGTEIKKAMSGMEPSRDHLRPVPELQSELDKLIAAGRPLLKSVTALGLGPVDGNLSGDSLLLEAATNDERTLLFVVKGFNGYYETPAALERLLFVREPEAEMFLRAIEAYLRGETP